MDPTGSDNASVRRLCDQARQLADGLETLASETPTNFNLKLAAAEARALVDELETLATLEPTSAPVGQVRR
jgi:hypothetical protein